MEQRTRGRKIGIQRTSFPTVKTHGRHHLWFDGTVLEFDLETKDDAPLGLRKTLNQDVRIKHSSGAVNQASHSLKRLLVYGALATGCVLVIREPLPLCALAAGVLSASYLFAKPTVRLIFDFGGNADAYIIAEVPSEIATELLAGRRVPS